MRKNKISENTTKVTREIARVVSDDSFIQRRRAKLIVRPIRLAFIIRVDLSPENIKQLLTYLSSIWGGYYSCLIPTDGKSISDNDWVNLVVYQPDKVVFCTNEVQESIATELITRVQNELFPFSCVILSDWSVDTDTFNLQMKRNTDPLVSSIPVVIPMQHSLDKLRQPIDEEKSLVRIPVVNPDNQLSLFIAAQVGLVTDFYRNVCLEGFKGKVVEFNSSGIQNYVTRINEIEDGFPPLNMTRIYVNRSFTLQSPFQRPEGFTLVLAGNCFVKDLCAFWNLRLAESFARSDFTELILPFALFRGKKNLQELCQIIKQSSRYHRKINIYSVSIEKRALIRFKKRLLYELGSAYNAKLVNHFIPIANFHTKSVEEAGETSIEKNEFSFKSPQPEFVDLVKGGEWAVDIKFTRPYEYPRFSQINHYLCGLPKKDMYNAYGGYTIRNSNEKFVHRSAYRTDYIGGSLISAEDAYKEVFQDNGYVTRLSEKHAYTEGFINLLQNSDCLEDPNVRNLFWKLQRQEAYTYDDLCSEIKRQDGGALIDDFVAKRILIRGLEFRCSSCGLLRFHPINTLDEKMQCPGCLKFLQPPSRAPIMFRLNELACQAVQQGSIPVTLTHKYMQTLSINRTLQLYGLEVEKNDLKLEIDYITTYWGDLVFVECKDFKLGALPKEKRNAIHQLIKLIKLATHMDASIVILSTLLPHPSPECTELAQRLAKLNQYKSITIHLLSLSQKGIVNLREPEKLVENPNLFNNYSKLS